MAAMKINHRAPDPPYRQIAADLTQEIESGALAPGSPMPSEKELVERYGVARNTVRSALALLRDAGLVYTVPGRGTYVRDRSADQPDSEA
ncbi:winged helix-turn-helix domain-containing protein [Streptomyces klenkii]|uniref:GntR family transcriptional regulator n=1 Tax=Streptomyces klenkii TaxID=1420899 RepID=UPI0033C7DBA0